MKLDTQRDRWQAVLDGVEIQNRYGTRFKFINNQLVQLLKMDNDWVVSDMALLGDDLNWQLYEPPKPENKVIFVYHLPDADRYYVSGSEAPYINENDAIRAAMEWLGEKVKHLSTQRPSWCYKASTPLVFEVEDDGTWAAHARSNVYEALLMRWPIEILEEV